MWVINPALIITVSVRHLQNTTSFPCELVHPDMKIWLELIFIYIFCFIYICCVLMVFFFMFCSILSIAVLKMDCFSFISFAFLSYFEMNQSDTLRNDLISRWSDAQNQIRIVSFCISVQWKFSKKRIFSYASFTLMCSCVFVLSRSWISSSSEVFSWETLKRSEDSTQRAANHSFRQIFSVRSERLTLVLSLCAFHYNNFDYEITLNSRATAMFNVWI